MSQPVEVYPNNNLPRQSNSSHSNGSFGPVFAVLGVIVVISVVACVVGRLCNRRYHRDAAKEAATHHHRSKGKNQSHGLGPKEWESKQEPNFNTRDGDIEFGFDKKIPPVKMAKNGGKQAHHDNGGLKPEVRFADNV